MKTLRALLAIAFLAFSTNAYAAVDVTEFVTATATIGGVTTMTLSPSTIIYGATGANAWPTTPADNKVVINYASNHDPWNIRIYTDNTIVPDFASGGSYAKGGLAKTDGTVVIPMKWIAKAGSSSTPAISGIDPYNYVKDKNDEDDPGQAGDQGWSETDGYPNIAFGNSGGGVAVDPTNAPTYNGDDLDGVIDVYIAALFGDAVPSAGSYSSKVYFDLMHE